MEIRELVRLGAEIYASSGDERLLKKAVILAGTVQEIKTIIDTLGSNFSKTI